MSFELAELEERGQYYSQQLMIWPLRILVDLCLEKKELKWNKDGLKV